MTHRPIDLHRLIAAALIAATAPVAAADLSGSAEVVSDYRFRGLSLSDRQPVAEGSIELTTGPWFAGAEALSASRVRSPYRPTRIDAEVDVSAGWSRSFGLLTPTAGAIAYLHPGGGEPAIGELFASVAGALGPATLTVGGNYAIAQVAARGGNLYLFAHAAAGIPRTPLTVRATVGRERGALTGGAIGVGTTKLDYSVGVEARVLRIVTLGLEYIANDLPTVGPGRLQANRANGIVLRARVSF